MLATDASSLSSAFHDADASFLVPRCDGPDFVPRMLELCETHRVDLVVPTIDPELPVYAAAREHFAEIGTTVAVSSPEVVEIASDKRRTHDWLVAEGFPTVAQARPEAVRASPDQWSFPLVVKPRFGSASVGVVTVHDRADLDRTLAGVPAGREMIVQELAAGDEHTIDVLLTSAGAPTDAAEVQAVVPRKRLAVRAGEVAKAETIRSVELIELAEKLCCALPGPYGPLNLQVFVDRRAGRLAVIEINARFGGGVPLSIAAGADMPLGLLQDALGQPVSAPLSGWQANLMMLRYDASVLVPSAEISPPEASMPPIPAPPPDPSPA